MSGRRRGKSFWERIPLADGGSVVVHVNRRGCKGEWTAKDAAALRQIVEVARTQFGAPPEKASSVAVAHPLTPEK